MITVQDEVSKWVQAELPEYLKDELDGLLETPVKLEDHFYQYLAFGTGGMRGKLGVGSNRINIFTIRQAAAGLAQYVASAGEVAKEQGVVIAYDTRQFSYEFAVETAKVLGAFGVRSYVFSEPRPTPQLSFAVRHLSAYAGVVITASHNPKEYNGFKVYGADGAQLVPSGVQAIIDNMQAIENIFDIETVEFERFGQFMLDEVDKAYLNELMTLKEWDVDSSMKLVYTPLHGAGLVPVTRGLEAFGFANVHVVEEQAVQDGSFPTVSYPNPEEAKAFEYAIRLGSAVGADLLLATDPDADRLGVAVLDGDDYTLLTGNQLGALVIAYVCEAKKEKGTLAGNSVVLKTIVTSELGAKIAADYGVETVDVLTGFKYIAEKIEQYSASGEKEFLFGYEESYGYLAKAFVRDKDAVQLALVTAEMASHYAKQGLTLLDKLDELFKTYGYHKEALISKVFEGKAGQEEMQELLASYRANPLTEIAGIAVHAVEDYLAGERRFVNGSLEKLELPKENVLKYLLADGSWVATRPSGTEPKCKFYIGVVSETADEAIQKVQQIKSVFE